jgi:hypothetical protein
LGNKGGKSAEAGDEPLDPAAASQPMDNSVSPAPLAMMEIEKTPISTPMHDVPPPPSEK